MRTLRLPCADGSFVEHRPGPPGVWPRPTGPITGRVAYAAAHVVADPRGDNVPGAPAAVDWEATLAFRRHLWSYGLSVAEAMDTAQRGMGLDWATTRELVRRSAAEARGCGGRMVAGAGTDHAPPGLSGVDEVIAAYPADEQPPGAWWVPASHGGSAPTPEEAARLDAEEKVRRAANRAAREEQR